MQPEQPSSRLGKELMPFRWPLLFLATVTLVLAAVLTALWLVKRSYEETLEGGGELISRAADTVQAIAERFQSGNITRTFEEAIPEIAMGGSGRLELVTSDQWETFRMEDQRTIFWDRISLGRTVSEIRVPVTYRYHVRLDDPWRLEVSGQTCIVTTPAIQPSLPPAIHTDRMEKKSEAGWARFNAEEQMAQLEKSVTPTLVGYAGDPRHLAFVREECRLTVAEFVKNWLLREDHWRDDRFHAVKVIFADESEAPTGGMEPTVTLR